MLNIDPNVVHAFEFLEYLDIISSHRLAVNSESEELFVGKQFANKEECVFVIKWYSMKVSRD